MSWIALLLGLILALAGGAALVASIDLLTTELGVLYATCGAIAVERGVIVDRDRFADPAGRRLAPRSSCKAAMRRAAGARRADHAAACRRHRAGDSFPRPSVVRCPRCRGFRLFAGDGARASAMSDGAEDQDGADSTRTARNICPRSRRSKAVARRSRRAADAGRPLQRRRRQLFDLLGRFDRSGDRTRRFQIRLDERIQSLYRGQKVGRKAPRIGGRSISALCRCATASRRSVPGRAILAVCR